jgi:hypothetical protein
MSPKEGSEKQYNPLLAEAFPPFFPTIITTFAEEDADLVFTQVQNPRFLLLSLEIPKYLEKQQAYFYETASWRVLIQQPLVRGLALVKYEKSMLGVHYSRHVYSNNVRTGVFYDLILDKRLSSLQTFWWGRISSDMSRSKSEVLWNMWMKFNVKPHDTRIVQCTRGGHHRGSLDVEEKVRRHIMSPEFKHDSALDKLELRPDMNGLIRYRDL